MCLVSGAARGWVSQLLFLCCDTAMTQHFNSEVMGTGTSSSGPENPGRQRASAVCPLLWNALGRWQLGYILTVSPRFILSELMGLERVFRPHFPGVSRRNREDLPRELAFPWGLRCRSTVAQRLKLDNYRALTWPSWLPGGNTALRASGEWHLLSDL